MIPAISRDMEKKKLSHTRDYLHRQEAERDEKHSSAKKGFHVKKSKDQHELGGVSEHKSNPVHFNLEGEIRPRRPHWDFPGVQV